MKHLFLVYCIVTFFFGCTESNRPKGMKEGVIDYEIIYPEQMQKEIYASLLPKEMSLVIFDDIIKLKIRGELNLFSLEFLSNNNGDSCYTLLKLPARKVYYPLQPQEKWFLFDDTVISSFKIYPDSIKTFAGISSHLVTIQFKDPQMAVCNAYFSDTIDFKQDGPHTPFDKIPGIPLAFEIKYNNLTFKFKASRYSQAIDKDEQRGIPDGYELTSRDDLENIISSILQ
jgi:hypothetical protein